ncbi:MAG: hypothetical protein ACI9YE_000473 [Psychroserpens sp.]|jgi:hypothetical protein
MYTCEKYSIADDDYSGPAVNFYTAKPTQAVVGKAGDAGIKNQQSNENKKYNAILRLRRKLYLKQQNKNTQNKKD